MKKGIKTFPNEENDSVLIIKNFCCRSTRQKNVLTFHCFFNISVYRIICLLNLQNIYLKNRLDMVVVKLPESSPSISTIRVRSLLNSTTPFSVKCYMKTTQINKKRPGKSNPF